jgi:hypothetical protein
MHVGNAETGNMLLDEILAVEMRDARLLVGIGNGRIDQMPDAGCLRGFRDHDSLTGLFLGPSLVDVAHQKYGVDATCCLQNRRFVTEIASHDISACRHQLPRSLAIRLAGQRLDAMSPASSARATAPPCWPVAPVTSTFRLLLMCLLPCFHTGAK